MPTIISGEQQGVSASINNPLATINVAQLIPSSYDEIDLTYIDSGNGVGEIGTVIYGKSGLIIATLTLSYDSSNKLINVTRS